MERYYNRKESVELLGMTVYGLYWHVKRGAVRSGRGPTGSIIYLAEDIEKLRRHRSDVFEETLYRGNAVGNQWPTEEQLAKADISPIRKGIYRKQWKMRKAASELGLGTTTLSRILHAHKPLPDWLAQEAEAKLDVPAEESKEWHARLLKIRAQRLRNGTLHIKRKPPGKTRRKLR